MSPSPKIHTIMTPWGTLSGTAQQLVPLYNKNLQQHQAYGDKMTIVSLRRFLKSGKSRLMIWQDPSP